MGDWVDPGDTAWAEHPRLREAAGAVRPEDEDGHWEVMVEAIVAGLHPTR